MEKELKYTPITQKLADTLLAQGLTLATAESCTGGNIAHQITAMAGSSAYFLGGVVAYSNPVKEKVLGVSGQTLIYNGAVSRAVVEQMAQGVQAAMHSDCAVATSGIAGPGGGTVDKPVGTVWIAALSGEELHTRLFHFEGDRQEVIRQSTDAALLLLLEMVQKEG